MAFLNPIANRTRSQIAFFHKEFQFNKSRETSGVSEDEQNVEVKPDFHGGVIYIDDSDSNDDLYGICIGDAGCSMEGGKVDEYDLENDVGDDDATFSIGDSNGGGFEESRKRSQNDVSLEERIKRRCIGSQIHQGLGFDGEEGNKEGRDLGVKERSLKKKSDDLVIDLDEYVSSHPDVFSSGIDVSCIAGRTRAKAAFKKESDDGMDKDHVLCAAPGKDLGGKGEVQDGGMVKKAEGRRRGAIKKQIDVSTNGNNAHCGAAPGKDVGGKGEAEDNGIVTKVEELSRGAGKRKRGKDMDLFDLLKNTIWENGGNLHDKGSVLPNDKEPFQVKFNYGIDNPKPVEKSDEEKLVNELWDEFDFALASCGGGSFGTSAPEDDIEEPDEQHVGRDQYSLCCQGKHDFYVDDQVGIKCRVCLFIQLEIKYVLPPIETRPSRRSTKKGFSDKGDFSMWEPFHVHDAGTDSQSFTVSGKGTVWDIFPRIKQSMYPHQQEGFEFLWVNVAGGTELDRVKKSPPNDDIGGCVISHAPGTGKTFLTIAFLRTYMEVFKECKPVIIAPCSMLLTWAEEFKKWGVDIPFHNLNSLEFSGKEEEWACKMTQGRSQSQKLNRMVKLFSWCKQRSILGVSYSLFETLAGQRCVKGKDNKKQGAKEDKEIRRILLEKPSMLVLDEGHTPRNNRSKIWKTLGNIKTGRRVILSGTPFQNNFEELYNTFCLVRPKFADKFLSKTPKIPKTTSKSSVKQDTRGMWASLTSSIGKHDDEELLEHIRGLIDPFVHVYRGSILQKNLPGVRGRVIVLDPLPLQREILEEFHEIENHLELEHAVSLVSVHPSLFINCKTPRKEKYLIDRIASNAFRLDSDQGIKARFLMEFIPLCGVLKEKILVFSQFIHPLVLIKDQLCHCFKWTEGEEVLQMDGKVSMKQRQSVINIFNDPCSKARVLLASTKTCREGINLTGASRVVLLDVVWNPSVEKQAISRAYRLGQKKVVYTYHLIASGTMEEDKYDRQVKKDLLSEMVFSSSQSCGDKQNDSASVKGDKVLEAMVGNKELRDMFNHIYIPA